MKVKVFTNDMLKQIRAWIRADKMVVAKNKRLKELRAKYRAALEEYRRADLDMFYKTVRSMKKVDWRLSVPDRRKELETNSAKHVKALNELFTATRRKLKKLETQMELAAQALGRRRGFLRGHFEQRFVTIAHRERIRQERRKDFEPIETSTK